ncbi:hypothetical protein [Robinsoniella peoriensis]|uniref:hypothetical protein n=1 Tax=Robinsoniella peoriensis TaxID=180332 RepID=UPI0036425E36
MVADVPGCAKAIEFKFTRFLGVLSIALHSPARLPPHTTTSARHAIYIYKKAIIVVHIPETILTISFFKNPIGLAAD